MFIPLEEGEELIVTKHRHWIFVVAHILMMIGFALLLPLGIVAITVWFPVIVLEAMGLASVVALTALWTLIAWIIFWQFWTTYYLDTWVITNRRIIFIDQRRLWDRNIALMRLDRVQDLETRIAGVIGTLLKYGSVHVQSAGNEENFDIEQIANPDELRAIISGLVGKMKGRGV